VRRRAGVRIPWFVTSDLLAGHPAVDGTHMLELYSWYADSVSVVAGASPGIRGDIPGVSKATLEYSWDGHWADFGPEPGTFLEAALIDLSDPAHGTFVAQRHPASTLLPPHGWTREVVDVADAFRHGHKSLSVVFGVAHGERDGHPTWHVDGVTLIACYPR
jgi:hypothetical protein